jgi:hypothetical protein
MPPDVVRQSPRYLAVESRQPSNRQEITNAQQAYQFEGAGAIARARFDRPEKNAITESMYDILLEAIENSKAEADPAVRILVVASTGGQLHRLYALLSKRA